MSRAAIPIPREAIADFCKRHHIRRLSLFGSVLRDDFGPESDIDVLVEFAPGKTPSLFDLGGMQQELMAMFGRMVDIKTPGCLSKYIRERVEQQLEVQYPAS